MGGTTLIKSGFSGTHFDQSTPLEKATFENCPHTTDILFPPDFDPDAVEGLGLK